MKEVQKRAIPPKPSENGIETNIPKQNKIPYSLKNTSTNRTLLISILKPLISSLSPSKRSNGARLLSIKHKIIHMNAQITEGSEHVKKLLRFTLFKWIKVMKKAKIKETSKDNLCNIARSLPNLENTLVIPQPIITTL